jgi:hypothetical protein
MRNSILKYSIQLSFLLLFGGINLLLNAGPDNKKTELLIADAKQIMLTNPDSALLVLQKPKNLLSQMEMISLCAKFIS